MTAVRGERTRTVISELHAIGLADGDLLIVRLAGAVSAGAARKIGRTIVRAVEELCRDAAVVVVCGDVEVERLGEADLAAIGLRRIDAAEAFGFAATDDDEDGDG